MKKLFFSLLVMLTMTLTSCGIYAQGFFGDDIYTDIVVNGRAFYVDGIISCYYYHNMYYYPYIWEGHHYFMPFDHMQPHGFIFRPDMGHRPDIRFRAPEMRRQERPMMDNRMGRDYFNRSSTRMQINTGGQRNIPQTRQFQMGRGSQSMSIGAPRGGGMPGGRR